MTTGVWWGKAVLLGLAVMALAGCNSSGSSGSSGGGSRSVADIEGYYSGEITAGGSRFSVEGLVAPDGRYFFYRLADDTSFTGVFRNDRDTGGVTSRVFVDDGSARGEGRVDLLVRRQSTRLDGDYRVNLDDGRRLSGGWLVDYEPEVYLRRASRGRASGLYDDLVTGEAAVLSIDSAGDMFLQSPETGCTAFGRLRVPDRQVNLYDIELEYFDCRGSRRERNGGVYQGIAFLDDTLGREQLVTVLEGQSPSVGRIAFPLVFQR
ncbi:hypothetical protein M0534_01555 [Methylonatrum kenyense]|uniref:hypothetical protein n=1 Tax=Methylonatrum kenyense TaxID=455253 RepID=UPI0020C05085|nr:hypothetical protein [Methylonatrum kenyense]MCK8515017.1 hypothetical protein [Methylonatrum kenyense]